MIAPVFPAPEKPARPAPAGATVVLQARIDPAMRASFVAAARKRNTTAAAALKALVAGYIEQPAPGAVPAPGPDYDDTERARLVVQMPAFLKDALRERALIEGFSASAWVASMIQSNLMRAPVMTDAEIEVLRLASYQLAGIGRNLNQIARNLNSAALQGTPVAEKDDLRLEQLTELRRMVLTLRHAIGRLVKARHRAWGNDENRPA